MQLFDYLNKEGLVHLIRKIMGRDVDISQAEYDALPESKNSDGKNYYIYDSDIAVTAEEVGFDGSTSGSTSINSQQALDELFNKADKLDDSLADYLPLSGGSLSGNVGSCNILPIAKDTYVLGSFEVPYSRVVSNYFHINKNSISYGDLQMAIEGTASADGLSRLTLGNNIPSGTAGNAYGDIVMYSTGANYIRILPPTLTSDNFLYLPSSSGKLALTSDVPQSTDKSVVLSNLTWVRSGMGMYYAETDHNISGASKLLAVTLTNFGSLSAEQIVQPMILNSKLGFISNVNSFTTGANVTVRVLYV